MKAVFSYINLPNLRCKVTCICGWESVEQNIGPFDPNEALVCAGVDHYVCNEKPEVPANAIRLDPAVDAAKRLIAAFNEGKLKLDKEVNDDVVTMAVVILQLAGHKIVDKTGDVA